MDETIDLLDRRGRFARLLLAAVIGGGTTFGLLTAIQQVAAKPDADALSQASPALLGIAMFVVTTWFVAALIEKLRKRAA